MTAITIYDIASGRALRKIRELGSTSAEAQVMDGETFVEGDYSFESYLDGGEVREKPERPSDSHDWDWATKTWQPKPDDARAKKKAMIDPEFDRRTYAPVMYDGAPFDADDRKSRARIAGLSKRLERGDGLPPGWIGWRDANNDYHWANDTPEVVQARLASLSKAIEDREQALLIAAWTHKAALDALTDIGDILAYDVTTGW